ncbi:MAG: T9SS type A sorting domain-containing protein [Ignavibacteria bacterium]|nr:T9SS type A sorting domain-containing protein [Ignavibacteria bacterium]
MKKSHYLRIIFSMAMLLFASVQAFPQNHNWIVPNKAYLKLSVIEDAMYRITRTDFTNAGVNTATVDPRTVRIFNKGNQIPIHFEGESDGVFDNADYFDFYGTRTYGGQTNYYNENNVLQYTKDEYYSNYSDTNVYWVEWGVSNGVRYSSSGYTVSTLYPLEYYYDKLHFEKDRIYTQGERIDGNDFRNFSNENFQGEGWYWTQMTTNQFVSDTFSLKTLTPQTVNATVKMFGYPGNRTTSINNEHSLQVQVNSTYLPQIFTNDFKKIDTVQTFLSTLLSSSSVNTIRVFYFSNVSFNGNMYFDFFEIQVPKLFKFNANAISANIASADTSSKRFRISGYVSGNQTNVYDVVNGVRITNYTSNADTLIFTAKGNAKLEVINKTITKKPFKIIQRQVPNLASSSNAADYIIVYHQNFLQQVYQLQNHRETYDNFRVVNAEIRDIYDIFNYGIEHPVAVRNFLKHAYDNWVQPRVKYAVLLGRATTDPKKNATSTVYSQNLVPTYGNPTTDSYFGNFNYGSYFYYPKVLIGRLPALNTSEASAMVENITSNELEKPQSWWKVNTFIVGGGTAEDQNTFQALDSAIINNYALPPPLSQDVHKIFRNDTTTSLTFNYKDSIRRDINNGCAIVNFLGHAGYENWEDGMQDPSTLTNYGKFPLVMSMTCYTGKTADPDKRTFSEQFVRMLNRGAVGFIGCSGWGWTLSQTELQTGMYIGIKNESMRRFGEILNRGKLELIQDSSSSTVRHTVNCYGLIGDPASRLIIPTTPEYAISSTDYRLSNTFPEINKQLSITLFPNNYGLFADSCKVRSVVKKGGVTAATKDTVIRNFDFKDSVRVTFIPDSLKDYSVQVILDPDNWNTGEDKTNNYLTIDIPLKEFSYVQLKPVNHAVIKSDTVEFSGINPSVDYSVKTVKALLEVDTTTAFNSPAKRSFARSNVGGFVTKFNCPLPVLTAGTFYYWRTNAVINGDSSGWTSPQAFSYNPGAYMTVQAGSRGEAESLLPDSGKLVFQKKDDAQYTSGELNNTSFGTTGIALNRSALNLIVRSMGSSGAEASFFTVNYENINIDGGRSPGLSMLKVRKLDGKIIQYKNVRMTSGQSSDSVTSFLNTFDSTYYLMALNASYVAGAVPLNATAKAKIRSFGSTKIDSFSVFGWFDTWSFIGYSGAPQSAVSEMVRKYSGSTGWVESNSSISTTKSATAGTVTNYFGPAQSWDQFSWIQTLYPQSSLKFDVVGTDRNGASSVLLSDQTTNQLVNISSIDAYQYPNINLLAKFAIDTLSNSLSSVLGSLDAKYTPPAELMLNRFSLVRSDTSLKVNDEMKVTFSCYNGGYVDLPGVICKIYRYSVSQENFVSSDTVYRQIRIDSTVTAVTKFRIPYIRPSGGYVKFFLMIEPLGKNNDIFSYNNSADFNVALKLNQTASAIEIYSDGTPVRSGDYVKQKPELKVVVNGQLPDNIRSGDTARVKVYVNGAYLNYAISERSNSRLSDNRQKVDLSGLQANDRSLVFRPELKRGENQLKVEYTDESGAEQSSEITLIVGDEMFVKDLYNFPNPMRNETNFLFNLTGAEDPGRCKIRIFTTAGRLIAELPVEASVGFNQVSWNGTDADGDLVANGVYLYKLVAEDDSKKETATQKLVILR